jgi:DNA polymerase-3 subunit delta'
MAFEHISGNEHVKKYLNHMVLTSRVGNSLLFAGPSSSQKELFAEELAKLLIAKDNPDALSKIEKGIHPDLRHYRAEGKIAMHSIDSLRQLGDEVYLLPNESPFKVFIIHDAERMLPYSANALLKTFEEPLTSSVIILLSDHPEKLLPTIMSRCRAVYFQHNENQTEKESEVEQKMLLLLAQNKLSLQSLKSVLSEVSVSMDLLKKNIEDAVRGSIGNRLEDLSASQKEIINKEIDGAAALGHLNEVNALFQVILAWYRDMHLIKAQGNPKLLIYPQYKLQLEAALARGDIKQIEDVEEFILQAKLAVERFTPLNNALETLFFKLDKV